VSCEGRVASQSSASVTIQTLLNEFVLPQIEQHVLQSGQLRTEHMVNAALVETESVDINTLSELLADGREDAVQTELTRLRKEGLSAIDLHLQTLSECARRLGDMWCDDTASFGDVTLGMVSLHRIMRGFRHELEAEIGKAEETRSILLTTVPGETHIFALGMVETFFRAAGWRVASGLDRTAAELSAEVSHEHFDLVGISVSGTNVLNSCRDLMEKIRNESKNPEIKILVGGPPFIENAKLVSLLGADGFAMDAKQALDVAKTICTK